MSKIKKIINYKFKEFNSFNQNEVKAANAVVKTGILSEYLAGELEGGYYVKKFENKLKSFFGTKHAITVNSWTSGLIVAVGALDLEPGDEIIVSPWTMSATATAILHWNCIPIFVDIEKDTFCLDPKKIEKKITPKTKAIITVDIFGQSSDIHKIKKIARKYSLKVICDSAQAPGSKIGKNFTGTLADIGGYSLNYHKHIHTGEGGILVTNNDYYAKKMKLLRNHGETHNNLNNKLLINNLGYNFRLGEIESAIGIEQLKKLKKITKGKINVANQLSKKLSKLPGIKTPIIRRGCSHVYYVYPIIIDKKINRKELFNILNKLGVQGLSEGYQLLHKLPMYKKKVAIGRKGFPWSISKRKINYNQIDLNISEELHNRTFLSFEICLFDLKKKDIENISICFKKAWKILKIKY
jgi:dTDP-4-amino-4,6-dideoxygalactose transaminase